MSTKNRVKFTVAGVHPLLYHIRDHLIRRGLALVPWTDNPDFALVGAETDNHLAANLLNLAEVFRACEGTPVLLLSTGAVYSDRAADGAIITPSQPMKETWGLRVNSARASFALAAESLFLDREDPTLVLRLFNVFGPSISEGVIPTFLAYAKRGEELPLYGSEYQTRAFLFEQDLYDCIDLLVPKFLEGMKGVYNLGGSAHITLKRVADTVWGLVGKGPLLLVDRVKTNKEQHWWKYPNCGKLMRELSWSPKVTVRKGIWQLCNDSRDS